jgi:DNA-binding MarR family transcriptional regulator
MQPRTVYLVKRLETEVTVAMSNALMTYDLTPLQFSVMSFVDAQGLGFSSAQLSRRFSMTPQSMNEIVTILERKNMLEKAVDPHHKRVLLLNLTEQGEAVLKACNGAVDALEKDLFKGLTAKELTSLRSIIGKFLAKAKENK